MASAASFYQNLGLAHGPRSYVGSGSRTRWGTIFRLLPGIFDIVPLREETRESLRELLRVRGGDAERGAEF
jgi:hypothetical protein